MPKGKKLTAKPPERPTLMKSVDIDEPTEGGFIRHTVQIVLHSRMILICTIASSTEYFEKRGRRRGKK